MRSGIHMILTGGSDLFVDPHCTHVPICLPAGNLHLLQTVKLLISDKRSKASVVVDREKQILRRHNLLGNNFVVYLSKLEDMIGNFKNLSFQGELWDKLMTRMFPMHKNGNEIKIHTKIVQAHVITPTIKHLNHNIQKHIQIFLITTNGVLNTLSFVS